MQDWDRLFKNIVCGAIAAHASHVHISGKAVQPRTGAAQDLLTKEAPFSNVDWENSRATAAIDRENMTDVAAAVFSTLHNNKFLSRGVDRKTVEQVIQRALLTGSESNGPLLDFSEAVRRSLVEGQHFVYPPTQELDK